MPPVKRALHLSVRVYAFWGTLVVALFLPASLGRVGSLRSAPVRFESIPLADGALEGQVRGDARHLRFAAVSIAGGPWHPAGGGAACRELPYLPSGTLVAYRTTDGSELHGTIEERPASTGQIATTLILALLAIVLSLTGAAIAVSGASRPALFAGAALAGLGHLAAARFLEQNASLVTDPDARNALVLAWVAFPRHVAFFWLASFLSFFPTDVAERPVSRIGRGLLGALALLQGILVPLFQIPGLLERLPVPTQAWLVGGIRQVTRLLFALGLVAAIALVATQFREFRKGSLPAGTRRRAEVVGAGLLAGVGPPAVFALVQLLAIAATGKPLFPTVTMALSFLPLLAIPAVLAYAMLAPRVLSVGLLVRKAVFLAFAERSVRIAAVAPMAALGVLFYRRRATPLGEILAEQPLLFGLAIATSVAGLRYGERIRPFFSRLFFRARGASPHALARISGEMRQVRDTAELAELLSTGIERVLGVEQVALFVRSESTGAFTSSGQPRLPLDASSPVVEVAEERPGPFRIEPDDSDDIWRGLSELDRNWLESTRTRVLVPLKGPAGALLGLLSVGEKLSELPLDAEEENFLAAAASSGALALENLLLRSSHVSAGATSRERSEREGPGTDEGAAALSCRVCGRVVSPEAGSNCPDDETLLEPAPIPVLLAGKYRFGRRIGAGGMGVVYKARDLALARDVAIKTLPSLSTGSARRFQREARAAALLIHPNLGLVFAAERWRGTPMLVLEYLSGGTLSERIRRGPVPLALATAWGAALASALEAIHGRGILHRDIKPSNVGFDGAGTPKLLDFGLARILGEAEGPGTSGPPPEPLESSGSGQPVTLSATSHVVGTVPYLSPEALQGHPPTSGFDLWGLSLTIYETVTGVNPFVETSPARTANRILTVDIPDPRSLRADCPEALAKLLVTALARSESMRFASARDLRSAFEMVGRGLPVVPLDSAPERAGGDDDPQLAPTL